MMLMMVKTENTNKIKKLHSDIKVRKFMYICIAIRIVIMKYRNINHNEGYVDLTDTGNISYDKVFVFIADFVWFRMY